MLTRYWSHGCRLRGIFRAQMSLRGTDIKVPLEFVRVQPYVSPKIELSNERQEQVDLRVLPVIFRFEKKGRPGLSGPVGGCLTSGSNSRSECDEQLRSSVQRGASFGAIMSSLDGCAGWCNEAHPRTASVVGRRCRDAKLSQERAKRCFCLSGH